MSSIYMQWQYVEVASGRCGCGFKCIIFKLILPIYIVSTTETVLWWIPQDAIDDESTLIQVMTSGNKPLPQQILAMLSDVTWHH